MTVPSWRSYPAPIRSVGAAVVQAVDAASATDPDAYREAAAGMAGLRPDAVGRILADVTRALIEEQHPDGLDSDDVQLVLSRCYVGASGWLGDAVDVRVIVAVIAGALGIHEAGLTYHEVSPIPVTTDEWPPPEPTADTTDGVTGRPPSPAEFAWHAPLVIADLLAADHARLVPYVDAAFADIARAEAMEQP